MGRSAIPFSSLTTTSLSPPLKLNLSRAALGITICPRSPRVTVPQMFFPGGAGGITPAPSSVPSFISLSIETP
jgi:hypothetical protein